MLLISIWKVLTSVFMYWSNGNNQYKYFKLSKCTDQKSYYKVIVQLNCLTYTMYNTVYTVQYIICRHIIKYYATELLILIKYKQQFNESCSVL